MSNEELRGKIWSLFNLEPDDDGIMPREFPAQRIVRHHNLDISYMKTSAPDCICALTYMLRYLYCGYDIRPGKYEAEMQKEI